MSAARIALLAGASGLVGRELLKLLVADDGYRRVEVLVRRPLQLPPDRKLGVHVVDFANLPRPFPECDDVFIALGTTIKVAGSKTAFRQVDLDFVVGVAKAAHAAGARRIAVVSALGANAKSRVFYNRVKGEAEALIASLEYESVVIARPSLLLGDRKSLGQPARAGEEWGERIARPIGWLIPKGMRPIRASDVAASMLAAIRQAKPGIVQLESGAMQPRDAPAR